MRKLIPISIIVLGLAGGIGIYAWQDSRGDLLRARKSTLQKQLDDVQREYDAVIAASEIKTDAWKRYCDPVASFCFKYPEGWTLDDAVNEFTPADKRVSAIVTNPEKTVMIGYKNPLIKDGSAGSAHIVDVSELTVSSQKIKLIGSYPVASDNYSPNYMYVDPDSIAGGVPGNVGYDLANSIFEIGDYSSVSLSGRYIGEKELTSKAQADAWFHSIEGKTVKAILRSFNTR